MPPSLAQPGECTMRRSTHFSSISKVFSTSRSAKYSPTHRPLYMTGKEAWATAPMARSLSSSKRARSYTFSRNPVPKVLETSSTEPSQWIRKSVFIRVHQRPIFFYLGILLVRFNRRILAADKHGFSTQTHQITLVALGGEFLRLIRSAARRSDEFARRDSPGSGWPRVRSAVRLPPPRPA